MQQSQSLENTVNTSSSFQSSRIGMLVYQFKEWRREKAFFDDYFANCMMILMGHSPIDYRNISHNNILVKSRIYDSKTGQYK